MRIWQLSSLGSVVQLCHNELLRWYPRKRGWAEGANESSTGNFALISIRGSEADLRSFSPMLEIAVDNKIGWRAGFGASRRHDVNQQSPEQATCVRHVDNSRRSEQALGFEIPNRIQHELDCDRSQKQAHDANGDIHCDWA